MDIDSVLPDFRNSNSFDEIRDRFYSAAQTLILDYQIERGTRQWPIEAIELYLYHPTLWRDCTTHGVRYWAEQQLERGTWYVHRKGKPSPNRSGIDITSGSKADGIFCGLLIAGIGEKKGSSTALKTIVRPMDETFDAPRWSDDEKILMNQIDGTRIEGGELRLTKSPFPRSIPLYVDTRRLAGDHIPARFKDALLRIAAQRWRCGPNAQPLN
ncbi:hypothetical protein [Rhodopseudomonas pseudopalustris]|uniref:Uncharacterized protein n=1 Tax=Rhodopseudomonas pseudopalustris TaxID=1513892 RepID=A0A1H8VZR5_9BRAD|nr:hypothetical protein [Rhodopseudomonas pseudopalustris]SEP20866.1 hypothetical protein SAMN05444123_11076 [Rhodopseudomonas pseudopalustris]